MGKLFVFNMVSLDGYFTGPDNNLDWHNVDKEFQEFAIKQLESIDTLLFGRVTYQMMADFWSTDFVKKADPLTAELMNDLPKIVVSRSLKNTSWKNSKLISSDVEKQILNLKKQSTKDIAVFGSSILCVSLIKLNLIDEFRIMFNPVILGSGRSLFEGTETKVKLKLFSTRQFKSGNVLLTYN